MTPSEYLIEQLQDEYVDELEFVVVLRKHKDGCISFSASTESRVDIYSTCAMTQVYLQTDIIKYDIKSIL